MAAATTADRSIAQDRELTEATDFRVRVQAALRLGRAGGKRVRPELEGCLRDTHPAVRAACAAGLASIGEAAAVTALEQAKKTEASPRTRSAMQEAIDKLQGGQAPPPVAVAVERAKYVVQLGAMRNNSGVRTDLDSVMMTAARTRAVSIQDAVVLETSDAVVMKRASERHIPVLLVEGSLTRLTQSTAKDGVVMVSAQVDMSIRRIPQQTLRGMVSGRATASDGNGGHSVTKVLNELQNRAVGSAVESAMASMGSEISTLAGESDGRAKQSFSAPGGPAKRAGK